jgi:hypothetical protein
MGFLEFLEQTALATFIRESSSFLGFPTFLFLHTLGLSLLVGANTIVAMRVLGMASGIPLRPMVRLFPFMWIGFVLTAISGTGLALASATSKFVNPLLLVKLVLVVIAAALMWSMEKNVFRSPSGLKEARPGDGKAAAGALLILWLVVMILGRLIAYSSTIFGS